MLFAVGGLDVGVFEYLLGAAPPLGDVLAPQRIAL